MLHGNLSAIITPPYSSTKMITVTCGKPIKVSMVTCEPANLFLLYEKYGVDVVWNGHIHSYERTWRVSGGQAVESGAAFLHDYRRWWGRVGNSCSDSSFFQNNVRRGHHYVMVHINGGTLEMKVFTLDDRLFDYHKINK